MTAINILAREIKELRAEKAGLNARIKDIDARLAALEGDLVDTMTNNGMDKATSEGLSMTLTIKTIPAVEDWDAVYEYVYSNKAAYLFQKRLTATTMQELRDAGYEVPGVRWLDTPSVAYRSV